MQHYANKAMQVFLLIRKNLTRIQKVKMCVYLSQRNLSITKRIDITVYHYSIPIIKPTRCTNFFKFTLEWNSTCFREILSPSSGVFHCTHSDGICHRGLFTAFEQDQNGTPVPFWSCSKAVCKPVWHISSLYLQWKSPDDGQRNCPKHVEFHSKVNLRN
jgi:hypothetical protein